MNGSNWLTILQLRRSNPELVPCTASRYDFVMKSASVQQVPQQWAQILQWIAEGEEVQVTQRETVVALLVPVAAGAQPDFLARARAVWGDSPLGKPLSALVAESRGSES
jgi:antitoxin (DNA-binding transcriptional repressor) of toxin-antitoxin stability system